MQIKKIFLMFGALIIYSASIAQSDTTKIRLLPFRKYFSVSNMVLKSFYYTSKSVNKNRTAFRKKKLLKNGYQLILEDQFDTLNTEMWRVGMPWGKFHPDNLYQYYADSVIIDSGYLYLANCYSPRIFEWHDSTVEIPFSIGLINADRGITPKYGYFEINCKMPIGPATWPAFWLTGKHGWPPEIDIFENYGAANGKKINRQTSTVHWGTQGKPNRGSISRKARVFKNRDTLFHTYGCLWTEKYIKFYTDGKLTNYIKVGKKLRNLLNDEMVIIINNAIDLKYLNADFSQYPTNYLVVDWIRVYQSKPKQKEALK